MTVREMQRSFELSLGHLDEARLDKLDSSDTIHYLNVAQSRFVNKRFSGNNVYQAGFQETQKRVVDLRTLVRRETIATPIGTNPTDVSNSAYFDLSGTLTDYLFYVTSTVSITDPGVNGGSAYNIGTKQIRVEELKDFMLQPFNNPIIREPLAVLMDEDGAGGGGQGVLLLHEGTVSVVANLDVFYIRKAAQLSLVAGTPAGSVDTCELPEYTHDEIVTLAVAHAAENFQDQLDKYGMSQAETQKIE